MSGRRFPLRSRGAAAKSLSLLVAAALCVCAAPRARGQESPKAQEKEDVVTVKSTLVNIDVMVKDKSGKYVTDLGPDDFTVYENGVRQKVEFFDPPFGGDASKAGEPGAATARTPPAEARNVISLVLDGQTTEQQNLQPLREGAVRYIRDHITDSDAVAVFNVSAGLQLLQPFTRDKAKLISVVEKAFTSAAASNTPERGDVGG